MNSIQQVGLVGGGEEMP
jgi:hypothetical protein